jgi:hypothetical protein
MLLAWKGRGCGYGGYGYGENRLASQEELCSLE